MSLPQNHSKNVLENIMRNLQTQDKKMLLRCSHFFLTACTRTWTELKTNLSSNFLNTLEALLQTRNVLRIVRLFIYFEMIPKLPTYFSVSWKAPQNVSDVIFLHETLIHFLFLGFLSPIKTLKFTVCKSVLICSKKKNQCKIRDVKLVMILRMQL